MTLLLVGASSIVFAQTTRVYKGTVLDPKGNPLAGATVGSFGGAEVTTTDANGNFTLEASRWLKNIIVTNPGMEDKKKSPQKNPENLVVKMSTHDAQWGYIYAQFSPGKFSYDDGSDNLLAVSLGYNHNISVLTSIPLYVECGLGYQWTHGNFYGDEVKLNLHSLKVPVGATYLYAIPNSPVDIIPRAGLDFRFNVVGRLKTSYGGSTNIFDSSEMGGSDYTWNRFQVGFHLGVNARIWKKLLVGYTFQKDLSKIDKEINIIHTQHDITFGYCF